MPVASSTDLVETLRQHRLLEPEQLDELTRQLLPQFSDFKELARELICRGWLTVYQVNQINMGHAAELVLGQYVVLDLLGQGGMGQVFKGRQRRLKRLAAIKVIRKECLASEIAVQRFHREAEAAARLSHPRIVMVYDAGEEKGVHFLAMEYLRGDALSKLLKKLGSLTVPQACGYIRQAALGLQHAHEQGLVHRDIKPSNLMLTKQGVIKVLDMGLARIGKVSENDETAGALTASGAVMGTPDYLAPEQALNAKGVDIRADIYSLGCSLYHLLTGRPPFLGESLTEKLLKHQMEQATAVETLRRDLPPELTNVLRKMMAKQPEERYQTPAEVATALASFVGNADLPPTLPSASQSGATALATPSLETTPPNRSLETQHPAQLATRDRPTRAGGRRWLLAGSLLALGCLLLVCVGGGIALLTLPSQGGTSGEKPVLPPGDSFTNSIGMTLVRIPAGKFTMGSPKEEVGRKDDEVEHEVQITEPFFMGIYAVTQEEYQRVMKDHPSHF